jgi:hypothetical protein
MRIYRWVSFGFALAVALLFTTRGGAALASNQVQQAFDTFQQAVAAAINTAQAQPYATGAENQARAAEFVRYLAQFLLDNQLGRLDPDHPMLWRNPDPFAIPGRDYPNPPGIFNPDNINYVAVISGAGTYQITAVRGNSTDLSFQAITGFLGDDTTGTPTATFPLSQLAVNPNHTYTIDIGQTPQPGNYLPTTAETNEFSIRETFNDWSDAVPDRLTLVRTDQSGPSLHHLSSAQMAAALNATAAELSEQITFWDSYFAALLSELPVNVVLPARLTVGGLPTQISTLIHFKLAAGQALVINVAPDHFAAYQGLEAADVWTQTLPSATHQSSLNATQAYLGSDGLFHFVISPTDPGVANWIDTVGHDEGFIFMRWQENTGAFTSADQPSGGLVSLSNLASVLPGGTPHVGPVQRAISLFFRDISVARRICLSSNPAEPVLNEYLRQIEGQVGSQALHTVYPPYVPVHDNELFNWCLP